MVLGGGESFCSLVKVAFVGGGEGLWPLLMMVVVVDGE